MGDHPNRLPMKSGHKSLKWTHMSKEEIRAENKFKPEADEDLKNDSDYSWRYEGFVRWDVQLKIKTRR